MTQINSFKLFCRLVQGGYDVYRYSESHETYYKSAAQPYERTDVLLNYYNRNYPFFYDESTISKEEITKLLIDESTEQSSNTDQSSSTEQSSEYDSSVKDDRSSVKDLMDPIKPVMVDVMLEFNTAVNKFPRFASAHEGYAVLLEEVDELWDAVKANAPRERLRAEAVQVAAMAIRFIHDVVGDK